MQNVSTLYRHFWKNQGDGHELWSIHGKEVCDGSAVDITLPASAGGSTNNVKRRVPWKRTGKHRTQKCSWMSLAWFLSKRRPIKLLLQTSFLMVLPRKRFSLLQAPWKLFFTPLMYFLWNSPSRPWLRLSLVTHQRSRYLILHIYYPGSCVDNRCACFQSSNTQHHGTYQSQNFFCFALCLQCS